MACYVNIGDNENSEELIEVPTEKDGTMLLSSVSAQFPGAVGLRFKTESGAWRGCRVEGNTIDAPLEGWSNSNYFVVKQASKRAADDDDDDDDDEDDIGPIGKLSRMTDDQILSDLMLAGLPYKATEDEVRRHFETYGELDMCDIKRDKDGKLKGFGFIRYKTVDAVKEALAGTHILHNRRVELHYSKRGPVQLQKGQPDTQTKLFVGRLPEGTTTMELQKHFTQYGVLKDVYIPTPFRGYGFVMYGSQAIANKVLNEVHVFKGITLNVGIPSIKKTSDNMLSGSNAEIIGATRPGMSNRSPFDSFMNMQQGKLQGNLFGGMGTNPWSLQGNMASGAMNTNPWSMQGKMQNNMASGGMNTPSWMQGKMQNNTMASGNLNTPSLASSWMQQGKNNMASSSINPSNWMQGKMQNNMASGSGNTSSWMQGKMQNNMASGSANTSSWMQGKMQNNMSSSSMNTQNNMSGDANKKSVLPGANNNMQTQNNGFQGNGNYSWVPSK